MEITEEEQKELKTIISYEEKKIRRVERNWDHAVIYKEREEKKLELDNKIADMLKDGHTYGEIKKTFNIGNDRISRVNNLL